MPSWSELIRADPSWSELIRAAPRRVASRRVASRRVASRQVKSSQVTSSHAKSRQVTPSHAKSRQVTPNHAKSQWQLCQWQDKMQLFVVWKRQLCKWHEPIAPSSVPFFLAPGVAQAQQLLTFPIFELQYRSIKLPIAHLSSNKCNLYKNSYVARGCYWLWFVEEWVCI